MDHFSGFLLGRRILLCLGSGIGEGIGDSGEVGVAAEVTQM